MQETEITFRFASMASKIVLLLESYRVKTNHPPNISNNDSFDSPMCQLAVS